MLPRWLRKHEVWCKLIRSTRHREAAFLAEIHYGGYLPPAQSENASVDMKSLQFRRTPADIRVCETLGEWKRGSPR